MDDQRTCGKGLAEHSVLPAKLGELTAALARTLEVHMKALDLRDEKSRKEYDAYLSLAKEYRKIAAHLQATAQQMAAYRDLPMGQHDQQALSAAEARAAFEKFVELERELLTLLQRRVEQDSNMLTEMDGART